MMLILMEKELFWDSRDSKCVCTLMRFKLNFQSLCLIVGKNFENFYNSSRHISAVERGLFHGVASK